MAIKGQNNVFLKVTVRIDEEGANKSLDRYLTNAQKKIESKGLSIFGGTTKEGKSGTEKIAKDMDKAAKSTKQATKELTFMEKVMRTLTGRSESLGWAIGGNFLKFAAWGAMAGIFYGITGAISSAISYVSELDAAYTDLAITTDYTNEQILEVDKSVSELTGRLGKLKTEVINAITEFARAGYSLKDSFELAEQAIIFSNIGQMDVATATEVLVAGLKAYRLEAEEASRITDVLFEVARKASIDPEGIGQAFLRSANTFYEAGATLEESASLIAAANESIQDPEKIGTALKTIAARLRGVDAESSLPLLQQSLKRIGVEIIDVDGGFRNMYDIMKDLSVAFQDLDELTKQGIMEQLAGKRQINILQGLIANFDVAESSLVAALNSTGIAAEKNAQYLESIQGKVMQFKNAVNELFQSLVSSDLIKAVVDGATIIITFLGDIIKTINMITSNAIPAMIAGIGAIAFAINAAGNVIMAQLAGIAVTGGMLFPVLGLITGAVLVLKGAYDLLKPSTEDLAKETEKLTKAKEDFNKVVNEGTQDEKRNAKLRLEALINERRELEKQLSLAQERARAEGRASGVNADVVNIQEQLKDNESALKSYGLTVEDAWNAVDRLSDSIKASNDEANKQLDVLERIKISLGGYEQSYNLLNDALSEYNEEGGLSKQTIQDLTTVIPDFVDQVTNQKKSIEDVILAQMAQTKSTVESEKIQLQAIISGTDAKIQELQRYMKALLVVINAEEAAFTGEGLEAEKKWMRANKAAQDRISSAQQQLLILGQEASRIGQIDKAREEAAKKSEKTTKEKIAMTKEEIELERIRYEISLREAQLKNATGEDRIRILNELIGLHGDEINAIKAVNAQLPKQIKDQDDLREALNKNNLEIEKTKNSITGYNEELAEIPIKQLEKDIKALTNQSSLLDEQMKNASPEERTKMIQEQIRIESEKYKLFEDMIKLLPQQIKDQDELAESIMNYRIEQERANNAVIGFQKELNDIDLEKAKSKMEDLADTLEDAISDLEKKKETKLAYYDKQIEAIESEIDALQEANDLEDERIKRLELQNELLELREKRQNILNEKNVKIIKDAEVGFEISADPREIEKVNDEIAQAEKDLADFEVEVERNKQIQLLQNEIDYLEQKKIKVEEYYNNEIEALEDQLETLNTAISDNQVIQEGIITTIQDSLIGIEGGKYDERLTLAKEFVKEYNAEIAKMNAGVSGIKNPSGSGGGTSSSGGLSSSAVSGMSDNQYTYLSNLVKTGTSGQAAWAKAELNKPSAASLDQSSKININTMNVTTNSSTKLVDGLSTMAKLS